MYSIVVSLYALLYQTWDQPSIDEAQLTIDEALHHLMQFSVFAHLAYALVVSFSQRDVLFIGTQFSNLYTALDTPAEAA